MNTIDTGYEYEKYRLAVGTYEGNCLQLVSNDDTGVSNWQTWKRKRSLGRGTFGEVWQEVWEDEHGDVNYRAVKVCSEAKLRTSRIDYRKELSALAVFSRSETATWFVNLHGWWKEPGHLCVAMEYLRYGTLAKYVEVGLPETDIKDICKDILQGLAFMHRKGFIHRDIKPEKLLVVQKRPEYPRWWVKIAGFGISKQTTPDADTAIGTIVGTPQHCAPEMLGLLDQHEQTSVYDNKIDMWSFGCVLFSLGSRGHSAFSNVELASYYDGRIPFNPKGLPIYLDDTALLLVKALLQTNPQQRPSASEALQHRWFVHSNQFTIARKPLFTTRTTSDLQPAVAETSTTTKDVNLTAWRFPSFSKDEGSKNSTDLLLPLLAASTSIASGIYPMADTSKVVTNSLRREHSLSETTSSHHELQNDEVMPHIALRTANHGKDSSLPRVEPSDHNENALRRAAWQGQLNIVQALANSGGNIASKDTKGATPLHHAAIAGHVAVVEWLVGQGADIDALNIDRRSPLHEAIYYDQQGTMGWLIKNGASVHTRDLLNMTPLHHASRNGRTTMVQVLLDQGCNIDTKCITGCTALYHAVEYGHAETICYLLDRGADINVTDKYGGSALIALIRLGNLKLLEHLENKGFNVHGCADDGRTLLHEAACCGQLEIVRWLADKGLEINKRCSNGGTPVNEAARWGHLEVVKYLVVKGANLGIMDNGGRTALIRARDSASLAVVEWITDYEASKVAMRDEQRGAQGSARRVISKFKNNEGYMIFREGFI